MTFVGQFNQISNSVAEKLRLQADGKTPIHLFNEINRATLDAIALVRVYLRFFRMFEIEFKLV